MRRWLVTAVAVTTACAGGRSAAPVPESGEPELEARPTIEVDETDLKRARDALEDGDLVLSTTLADSLFATWMDLESLEPGPVADLVDLLDSLGEELDAARFLAGTRYRLEGGERDRLRELAEGLSTEELDRLLAEAEDRQEAAAIVRAELARALAQAGRTTRAGELAEAVLAGDPDGADRRKAEAVRDGDVAPASAPIRIGAVLPGSGRFAAVGEQILEGALLAVELRNESAVDRLPVELIVLDDSSSVETGIRRVDELRDEDVMAVLGPIRTEALSSAAARREDDDLLFLSPTAAAGQGSDLNVYSAWDRSRRESDVARALAAWMAGEMGIRTFGVLHPQRAGEAALEAIREELQAAGADVVAVAAYAPDSTTFEGPIGVLAAAEPSAVIVLADRPRTVLQMAPQLVYYGLRRWVTGGDANWSDPSVARRLDASYADYRLVGTYVDRVSSGTGWQEFRQAYEAKYRKSLPSNMFAALGYDAMSLILAGLPEAGYERRGAVGRAIRRMDPYPGATGSFRVDRGRRELHRDAFVRVLMGGELLEPDPTAMREWAEDQLELEEFLKALEEEKEKEKEEAGRGRDPSDSRGGR